MLTGTKQSIQEIDAFLNKSILGHIVILNNEAFLYTTTDIIKLNKDHKIKVANRRVYVDVKYDDIFKLCDFGMYLYAGRTALIN